MADKTIITQQYNTAQAPTTLAWSFVSTSVAAALASTLYTNRAYATANANYLRIPLPSTAPSTTSRMRLKFDCYYDYYSAGGSLPNNQATLKMQPSSLGDNAWYPNGVPSAINAALGTSDPGYISSRTFTITDYIDPDTITTSNGLGGAPPAGTYGTFVSPWIAFFYNASGIPSLPISPPGGHLITICTPTNGSSWSNGQWQIYNLRYEYETFLLNNLAPVLYLAPNVQNVLNQPIEAPAGTVVHPFVGLAKRNTVAMPEPDKLYYPDIVDINVGPQVNPNEGLYKQALLAVPKTSAQGLITELDAPPVLTAFSVAGRQGVISGNPLVQFNFYPPLKTDYKQYVDKPNIPSLTAAVVGNTTQLTVYSTDNLLSANFYGSFVAAGANATRSVPSSSSGTPAWQPVTGSTVAKSSHMLEITGAGTTTEVLVGVGIAVEAARIYAVGGMSRQTIGSKTYGIKVVYKNSGGGTISTDTQTTSLATGNQAFGFDSTAPALAVTADVYITVLRAADTCAFYDAFFRRKVSTLATTYGGQGGYLFGDIGQHLCHKPFSQASVAISKSSVNLTVTADTQAALVPNTSPLRIATSVSEGRQFIELRDNLGGFLAPNLPSGTWITYACNFYRTVSNTASIGIKFYGQGNQDLGTFFADAISAATSTKTAITNSVTIPAGAIRFALIFMIEADANAAQYFFDNFRVNFGQVLGETNSQGSYGHPLETPESWIAVERQISTDSTWATIFLQGTDNANVVFTDNYVSMGTNCKYRARTYAMQNGVLVKSDPSAEVTINQTAPTDQRWILWSPTHGRLDFDIDATNQFNYTYTSDVANYNPTGKNRVILKTDIQKGRKFSLNGIDIISLTELNLWKSLHITREVLILARPWKGEAWPVMLSTDITVQEFNTNPVQYKLNLAAEEVDVPNLI